MQLSQAFSIHAHDIVAFVGGGGKTTAMFRLAEEWAAQGKRVITTTTTRIFASQIQLAPRHVFAHDLAQTLRDTQAALRESPHVLVIGATGQDGKAFGVEPEWIDALAAEQLADLILIEADGSRMRPFKAPAEHEPVVPSCTTLLVPVVGAKVLGKPLNDENVHRAASVAQRADIAMETPLNAQHIARVLAHPEGGLKNCPPRARVIPLVNQVETDAQIFAALEIARELLTYAAINAVAIGAVKQDVPIARVASRTSAVILAAGGSTRMRGQTKQLLPWGDGSLVQNAVRIANAANVFEIVVVTGNAHVQVENEMQALREISKPLRAVFNPDWATGRASSVRTGLVAVHEKSTAAVFINADQPFLSPQVIDVVLARYTETCAPIVVPTFDGQTGSPVLFARALFDELSALRGDAGGKNLLETYRAQTEHVAIQDARAALDLDTPEEYARARGGG